MSIEEERSLIHRTIQEAGLADRNAGAFLTAWVVVAEWVDPQTGYKWLSRLDSEGSTKWLRQGMLAEAMKDDWDPEETDDNQ